MRPPPTRPRRARIVGARPWALAAWPTRWRPRAREGCTLAGFVEPRASLRRVRAGRRASTCPRPPTLAQLLARAGARCRGDRDAERRARIAAIEAALDRRARGARGRAARVRSAEGADRLAPRIAALEARPLPAPSARSSIRSSPAPRACWAPAAFGKPREVRALGVRLARLRRRRAARRAATCSISRSPTCSCCWTRCSARCARWRRPATGSTASGWTRCTRGCEFADGLVAGVDGSWSVPGYPCASLVVHVKGDRGHEVLVSDDALETDAVLAVRGCCRRATRGACSPRSPTG